MYVYLLLMYILDLFQRDCEYLWATYIYICIHIYLVTRGYLPRVLFVGSPTLNFAPLQRFAPFVKMKLVIVVSHGFGGTQALSRAC